MIQQPSSEVLRGPRPDTASPPACHRPPRIWRGGYSCPGALLTGLALPGGLWRGRRAAARAALGAEREPAWNPLVTDQRLAR